MSGLRIIPASCGCHVIARDVCFRCGKCNEHGSGHCICRPSRGATGLEIDRMIRTERAALADRRSSAQVEADERWNQKLERENDDADQW